MIMITVINILMSKENYMDMLESSL